MALAVGGLILLDTAPGHRFIVDRLAQFETASGLKVRVARIEGSIYGETRLKGVADGLRRSCCMALRSKPRSSTVTGVGQVSMESMVPIMVA